MMCRHGKLEMLKLAHEKWHVSLTAVNLDGKTPLHEAASNIGVMEYLLSNKVSVNPLKKAGWTPLMTACTKSNNLQCVIALVNAGANLKLVNKDGWNCFHIACREGDVSMVEYLYNRDSFIAETISTNGRTPVHTAALHGKFKVLQYLTGTCKLSMKTRDACGSTALMDAIRSGNTASIELLIHFGESVYDVDSMGRNGLHIAAEANQCISIEHLITTYNCDINEVVRFDNGLKGQTALHLAYKTNSHNAVTCLIRLGADINALDNQGRKPINIQSKKTFVYS
uniref:Uncharacterized protein n=1 Tax=Ciona savignyi TaxID=51511 RepID=H2Z4W8_CIOSA